MLTNNDCSIHSAARRQVMLSRRHHKTPLYVVTQYTKTRILNLLPSSERGFFLSFFLGKRENVPRFLSFQSRTQQRGHFTVATTLQIIITKGEAVQLAAKQRSNSRDYYLLNAHFLCFLQCCCYHMQKRIDLSLSASLHTNKSQQNKKLKAQNEIMCISIISKMLPPPSADYQ